MHLTLVRAHCPTPVAQKHLSPRDAGGMPQGRQGIYRTPWRCTLSHACHAKAAEPKAYQRDARGSPKARQRITKKDTRRTPERCQRNARVYIRSLGNTRYLRLSHKISGVQGTPEAHQEDVKEMSGHTSDPLALHIIHACHAKVAEPDPTKGTPGRTSDPLTLHIAPRLPRKNMVMRTESVKQ